MIGEDPGAGWTIGSTSKATVDHVLVRDPSVKSPSSTWNTDEWIIKDKEDSSDLGSHTFG